MLKKILKYISPLILAIFIILLIETAIQHFWKPDRFDQVNILEFSFAKNENFQRVVMYHKLKEFSNRDPVIVQSGDSSGFYGIDPRIIEQDLPDDISYLNVSCCANLGFKGYLNVMKFMKKHSPSMKMFVLYFTPYSMPNTFNWDGDGALLWDKDSAVFGDVLGREYVGWQTWFQLPSLALRREVTDYFYYLDGKFNLKDRPLNKSEPYLAFLEDYKNTNGWTSETDIQGYVSTLECGSINSPTALATPQFFDFSQMRNKYYLEDVLETFASEAEKLDLDLAIIFQPVACGNFSGQADATVRKILEKFKTNHPNVYVPFEMIETWPYQKFTGNSHVKNEYSKETSERLGKALGDYINSNW